MNSETPDDQQEDQPSTIEESVDFVVDMMNSGNVDPKIVYPRGNRYHGD